MTRCKGQGCVHWAREGALCERCRRLTEIGHLVELVFWHGALANVPEGAEMPVTFVERLKMIRLAKPLDFWQVQALDAVAFLLTDHAQLKKAWRELHAEAEEGISRAARDSFSAGLLEGLDQRNRG